MENLTSRKEKFSNSKSRLTKKVAILAIAGSITIGAGAVLGASPLLDNLKAFISDTLGTKNAAIETQGETTKGAKVSEIETFLIDLKETILNELGDHTETEKNRVTNEISDYNKKLKDEATVQANTDIEAGQVELTNTADSEISEAKAALDAKYAEIFPASEQTP